MSDSLHTSPIFAALLTPHRSLDLRGIRLVVLVYAVLSLVPALYFFLAGAWPVIGFLGLDAALLYWALSASLKAGKTFEEVTLWPDKLEVRHVSPKGKAEAHHFNPFWVRFKITRDYEKRVTQLALIERKRRLEIGSFLNPDDKTSFANVFGTALARAKN